jgi:hypothetical protein
MTDTRRAEYRAEYVAGLHALADHLAEHPDLPLPQDRHLLVCAGPGGDDAQRAEVDRIAAALGVEAQEVDDGTAYAAMRSFGPIVYRALAITQARMARHYAMVSYSGMVEP